MRFGHDRAWVRAQRSFSAFLDLEPDDAERIHDPGVRARHAAEARPAAEVLEEVRAFAAEADNIVAYNGLSHDFPLLERAYEREGLPGLDLVRPVDGYYLALCLWPTPPRQHRLLQIAERLRISAEELVWHDALDDARLLALIMGAGARQLRRMDGPVRDLVAAVAGDGDAFELLFDLARIAPATRTHDDGEVARILGDALADRPRRRRVPPDPGDPPAPPAPSLGPLAVPASMRDERGALTPLALARAARPGHDMEPREAQEHMADELRRCVGVGSPALIEAPTGTGKSYAMLAAAIDWLSGDPERRVVISTFTKQLQAQLAGDIDALSEEAIPGLRSLTDLVKGAGNRLSLRAVVVALADATARATGQPRGVREALAYRELLVYLALRLLSPTSTMLEDWESRSIDSVDIPAFFEEHSRGRRSLYLATLSQAAIGEYRAGADELSLHTDRVAEALSDHRLVVANHALLMANRDELAVIGPKTLLLIDEAHALEDAATAALSTELEYQGLERLVREARGFFADASSHPAGARVAEVLGDLERFLDTHRLPQAALELLDGDEPGSQRTLASPFSGGAGLRRVEILRGYLGQLERQLLGPLESLVRGYAGAMSDRLDHFTRERLFSVLGRTAAMAGDLRAILADLAAVLGQPGGADPAAAAAREAGEQPGDATDEPETEEAEAEDEATDQLSLEDEGHEEDGNVAPAPAPAVPNRVVYLEHLNGSDLARGPRFLRFRIVSAPIELPADPGWRSFTGSFPLSYYVSATLQVAGSFGFVRERLGLEETVGEVVVESPFDMAGQARLVCLSDFPSWAEQAQGAIRSVAHQLAGYARECIVRDDPAGPARAGAMVLTTAKGSAAGIAERLETELVERGLDLPVVATEVYGNQRAVASFRSVGGILCGTKGLWQGVDVEDPERLGLVWINKLPFAPFADPLLVARRAQVAARAEAAGEPDPEAYATEHYYLAKGAIELRQAVGRLIRSRRHRGVVVISDRKLAGATRQRHVYRRVFLGSLDPGLLEDDPETGEAGGGNVVTMAEGWRRIWQFTAASGRLSSERRDALCEPDALEAQVLLPATRAIAAERLSAQEVEAHRAEGTLTRELLDRAERVAGHLKDADGPLVLHPRQADALAAVAADQDLLAILPTGYGKSFTFQLPALILPGLTLVVSPLVSLMHDQALDLNRTIGGAVRALVASLPESSSRMGKAEVSEQLSGTADHGIRIVYVSPERMQQRQFQDMVRRAVAAGIVRRIAIDEAHTLVQWGDDFRPSFRRMERFLRELRAEHPGLRLTAVTATANRTVREGLRAALFGLPPSPPTGGDPPGFRYVTANPLRPELALHRRVMPSGRGGPMAVAGLVEAVVEQLQDHAIFYCLTVREVDALHAQLTAFVGPGEAARVRRYHGRLSEIEKASVTNDFRAAPARGEESFSPMVVVATSAFGLGIDRPDIRCVFVVSPPTDLAALYQQLGRAGRDGARWTPGADDPADDPVPGGPAGTGLALVTGRSIGLVRWMTSQDLSQQLLRRIGDRLLSVQGGVLSASEVARDLVTEDHAAGRLSHRQAVSAAVESQYRGGVMRVLAALSAAGALDDLGDFPETVAISAGERPATEPLLVDVLALALAPGPPAIARTSLVGLHERLAAQVEGYETRAADAGATWTLLQDLHIAGHLDVSQAPNRDQLTGLVPHRQDLPDDFLARLGRRQARSAREIGLMRDWYQDRRCAAEGLGEYFEAQELPEGICATAAVRCSSCWTTRRSPGEVPPGLLSAFQTPRPRPLSVGAGRPQAERRLDDAVERLVWDNFHGLTPHLIRHVLRGADSYFDRRAGRRRTLWPRLLHHRLRGMLPGLSERDLNASVERLRATGVLVEGAEGRMRLVRHVQSEQARAARAGAQSGAGALGA